MRCLSDADIESYVTASETPVPGRQRRHVESCAACRARVEQAAADLRLIQDLRELHESRRAVRHLVDTTVAATSMMHGKDQAADIGAGLV